MGPAPAPGPWRLPAPGGVVIALFGSVTAVAWAVTAATPGDLMGLIGAQLGGATPVDRVLYVGLVGVMMVAMMLPSALPMLAAYRGLLARSDGARAANVGAVLFSLPYFLVWSLATAAALVGLAAFGLLGGAPAPPALVPGVVLAAAGVYQFTGWKRACLSNCRTPFTFLVTNWRPGRWGALRLGLDHSAYCIGCCWLLMAVVFVTGGMSLLWMGVFSGLILLEKLGVPGEWVPRLLGGASVAVGGAIAAFALLPAPLG